MKPATPQDTLFHGTSATAATGILTEGLKPQSGAHVHLFDDISKAREIASAHDKPAVFTVFARAAHDEGQAFWQAENGDWLTEAVETDFLYLPPIRGTE